MLHKSSTESRNQIQMISVEDLVPQDHSLRKIDEIVDFNFIYDLVKDLYCEDNGRPSIDPVVLFKIAFLQYYFGIKSMRRTIEEIEVNVAYRWFLGFDFNTPVPHFSTFGKNYSRRFEDTDLFEEIFAHILGICMEAGYINTDHIFVDSTHVKAAANPHKKTKKEVLREAKWYQRKLDKEINEDRKSEGNKPFDDLDDDPPPQHKTVTQSTTDPESGLFHKGDHKQVFAYSVQTACDENGWILGCGVYPGNEHDGMTFKSFFDRVIRPLNPKNLIADAGYKTPAISNFLHSLSITAVFPYTRPQGSTKDLIPKKEFVYDEYHNCYLCPENQVLSYSTTSREGQRIYKSKPYICSKCPRLEECTRSKQKQRTITRHLWQDDLDQVEDNRFIPELRDLYKKRKETIERAFAAAKEQHNMRYTNMIGRKKMEMKAYLTFACMNIKKLVKILT